MDIINYLNSKITKKKQLNNCKRIYNDLIKEPEIDSIINNMPSNLTQIEKAYYIYLELGKLITEDTEFVFGNRNSKKESYYYNIDKKFIGICKSISELYVAILADERVGIEAETVKQHPDYEISHVDTILKINGSNYLTNLIIDLSNIKYSRRTNGFCIDLEEEVCHPLLQMENEIYLAQLQKEYGEIDYLDTIDLQEMDKKLKYSFFMPDLMSDYRRGIYADDTIEILKYELRKDDKFKEYILKGKNVPMEEHLKYKLDFIFDNKDSFAEVKGRKDYLENIRYYNKLFRKFLNDDEYSRIQTYAAAINNDLRNIISIIKVKSHGKKSNIYYFYNKEQDKYEEKTPEEMKDIIDELNKYSLKIVGNLDRLEENEVEELEL